MIIVGLELVAPFDSFDHAVDPFASAPPLSLHKPLVQEAAKFAFHIDDSHMPSSTASKPKSSVSKLESYKFLDYFD
jgi:hypothetical protein